MPKRIITSLYLFIGLLIFAGCGQGEVQSPVVEQEKTESTVAQHVTKEESKTPKEAEVDEQEDEEEKVEIEVEAEVEVEEPVTKIDGPLSTMKVHFIDVGQADATLIEFGDGDEAFTLLIDTGNWNSSDVVSYLQSQNISDIDIIAITHPHADHIGQLDQIINAFDVSEVWMNGETATSDIFASALAAIENSGVEYYEPEVGEVFDIGPLEVAVLHPDSLSGGTNDNSIAMHLQYGDVSFLFTGDAETKAENDMLNRGAKLKADVLQVGHHGSNTSTTDRFLKAVNPEVAIYSAGTDSQYDHPHIEVINRLEDSGALVYGTDVHGTVIVDTDGKSFNVKTNTQGTINPTPKVEPKTEPKKETKEEPKDNPPPAPSGSCVNINAASEADIQSIIHIGPARATDLIELRPYNTVNDLSRIKGIGPARIKDIITQGIACTGG